jgi:hypothetical protein
MKICRENTNLVKIVQKFESGLLQEDLSILIVVRDIK